MYSSIFFFSLLFIPFISGNCTTWSFGRWSSDGDLGFSTTYQIPVDHLACPLSSSSDCSIPRNTYNLDVHRHLNISASPADIDGIFALARANFGLEDYVTAPFADLNTTVSTAEVSAIILDVKKGMNKTLTWVPFMRYSLGTLGNCTNETLNGVGVAAVAPYYRSNTSIVAGTWYSASINTIDGSSGAGRLEVGSLWGLMGSLALMFVLASTI